MRISLSRSKIFLTAVLLLLTFTTVGGVLWYTMEYRSRAGDNKLNIFSDRYVVREGESYKLTIPQNTSYRGNLTAKTYKCDLTFQNNCSVEREVSPWTGATFANGFGTIKLGTDATPGIYHAKFKIAGYTDWSDEIIITVVSKNATEEYMKQKTFDLFKALDAKYPLEQQTATAPYDDGIDTIGKVESKYTGKTSAVDLAHRRAELFTGKQPDCQISTASCREDTAKWRKLLAARHLMLADYYSMRIMTGIVSKNNSAQYNDTVQKIADHTYQILVQLDILASMPKHGTAIASFANNNGFALTLGDTAYAQRYLPDFGMGAMIGLSGIRENGLFPSTYCSYYERFGAGTLSTDVYGYQCRKIDLNERLANISSAIAVSVASRWMYKDASNLRTEYINDDAYWRSQNSGQTYTVTPNNSYTGTDLLGRNYTLPNGAVPQSANPSFYAWQMSGMASAAKMTLETGGLQSDMGMTALYTSIMQFGSKAVAYEFASNIKNDYGYNTNGMVNQKCDGTTVSKKINNIAVNDCVGGKLEYSMDFYSGNEPLFLGDKWQHLGVILATNDWSTLPTDYTKTKNSYISIFNNTLWKDGYPYINFTTANFEKSTLNRFWPGKVCSCGSNASGCSYYSSILNGKELVVSNRWEYAQDYVISALPTQYRLMQTLGNQDESIRALGYMYVLYESMISDFPNPKATTCGADSGFAGGNTNAGSSLRMGVFIMQTAYPAFYKVSID